VVSGVLPPGSKLPSKRAFALHLGISVMTVESAYSQLVAEGYLYSLPRKGFFVADIRNRQPIAVEDARLLAPPEKPAWFVDFVSNHTEPDNFPFSVWNSLMRKCMTQNQQDLMQNAPAGGLAALRQAIANHLQAFRGMRVSPEQIIIGAGTDFLYSLLVQLLGYDCHYAAEDPGYAKIAKIYQSHHVAFTAVPVDHDGISVTALAACGADVVHCSPSHHYPTGIVMPVSRRYALLSWAAEQENRYIIEDDFDSEFRMTGKPIPTLQSMDATGKVIYMNTFTKSLSSTIRIGYMVLPPPLAVRFYEKLGFYACTVSAFEQLVLANFIADGYFETHINRMRNRYRQKRDALITALRTEMPAGMTEIGEEEAGLHFLLQVHTNVTDTELVQRAARQGLHIACLSSYYAQADMAAAHAHTLVLNYSSVPETVMGEAAKRLRLTIDEKAR
jgi:GntR family transcriptional regulator/MocR family aminotransferase